MGLEAADIATRREKLVNQTIFIVPEQGCF
jgi:hypothetical protein